MNAPYFRVECFKGFVCKKTRKFKTAEAAVNFANGWHDDHYDDGDWDVQIIAPSGNIYQTNRNGNEKVEGIR